MFPMIRIFVLFVTSIICVSGSTPLTYEGTSGPGKGKHIVFIANDHEYRSEETCPAIARILAKRHGFKCTVLFGIDEDGYIKAGSAPVPGIEILEDANLLFFFTRFMKLPDEQVDYLVNYFERGGPVVGIRTSTHCFNGQKGKWAKLNFNNKSDDYLGGLGEQIFGNTWNKVRGQSHYGANHSMGGTITPVAKAVEHPINIGVGPIHCYSGPYLSQPPVGSTPLLDVQVLSTFEPSDKKSPSHKIVNAGWTRDSYVAPSGQKKNARVVYTSFGASEDIIDEDGRRFMVNACLWACGMEQKIKPDLNVDFVGEFNPSPYSSGAFFRVGVKPSDLADWESAIMPTNAMMGGLDISKDDRRKGRIERVLRFRPRVVKELEKNHPGFDLKKFE